MKNKKVAIGICLCVIGVIMVAIAFLLAGKDWSKLNIGVKYEHLQYVCSEDATSIVVRENANKVIIQKGNVDKITVDYCYDKKTLDYTFEESDSTLSVKRVAKKFSFFDGIQINFETPKLIITVPEGKYDNLDVKLTSGSLEISELAVSNITVKDTSGSVKLSDIECDTLNVKNTSGVIKLNDITASSIETGSTSGRTDIENVETSSICANVSSGTIKFVNVSADEVNGEATSGSMKLEKLDVAKAMNLKLTSGSVSGSVVGAPEDFTIISNITSGTSNLTNGGTGSKQLNCNVTSGSIKIKFTS